MFSEPKNMLPGQKKTVVNLFIDTEQWTPISIQMLESETNGFNFKQNLATG